MNKDFKAFGLATGAAAFGVIVALLAMKTFPDVPGLKQARDVL